MKISLLLYGLTLSCVGCAVQSSASHSGYLTPIPPTPETTLVAEPIPNTGMVKSEPLQPSVVAMAPTKPAVKPSVTPSVDLTPVPFETARARFIEETAQRFNLEPSFISSTLDKAQVRSGIVAAMARPAERVKPWSEYRPIFVTPSRIQGGQAFLNKHRDELRRVQEKTGVPAEIIVSIIGVETGYGANSGKHLILDALYTLAFNYPRSGDPAQLEREVKRELFFRDELAQFFALANEEKLDMLTLTGSYAGAMGLGQFMPSSYRQFAVDGDGDGRRNLFTNFDDTFYSIANYFLKKGGWQPGQPVVAQAQLQTGYAEWIPDTWTPDFSLSEIQQKGYQWNVSTSDPKKAMIVGLDGSDGRQYWLGFQNYYAITRYNNSRMYALAVYQLAEAIAGREIPNA